MSGIVGVDAGASHTEAAAAPSGQPAGEQPTGRAVGGGGAVRLGGVETAAQAITDTVSRALAEAGLNPAPIAVVVGAAGAGRDEAERALLAALQESWGADALVRVVTDGEIALEAAFPGRPGILLAAGTGSIAYAREPDGRLERVGGLGWRVGDEGSGFALARAALRAVARAADRRGPHTDLAQRLTRAVGVDSVAQLAGMMHASSHTDLAALAPAVCEAALAGDAVARGLVREAALDLAQHVAALLPLFTGAPKVAVALTGGLIQPGSPVRDQLVDLLLQDMPAVELHEERVDPPLGALRMARQLLERVG
jgi:N-acetylglucosamine kinase-like BadF-type ATPase